MQAVEVSTPAQEAGMRLDDIIIGINGKRLSSLQRWFRIKNGEGIHTVEVLRNGETVTITMPDPRDLQGKWSSCQRSTLPESFAVCAGDAADGGGVAYRIPPPRSFNDRRFDKSQFSGSIRMICPK